MADSGSENNISLNVTYKKYHRRWWILGSFSILACLQCMVWNTYGPIVSPVQYAYGWSNATVAMMANWGTIMFIIVVFPFCWITESSGLRVATLLVAFLVAVASFLRIVSTDDTAFLACAHISAILNGMAGAIIMAAPPAISATWFPPEQRTTATAINQAFNNLGNGLSFIVGPFLVPDRNWTMLVNDTATKSQVKEEILIYMDIEAIIAIALLIAMYAYYPSTPPSPPSASASIPRTNFKDGLKAILKDKNVLLCTFGYSMSGGIISAWQAVMTLNFVPLGVDDEESGRIGLICCFSSMAVSLSVSYVTDHLRKHMKVTLCVLLILEAACFSWLTLICAKIIAYSSWQLYASTVIGSSCAFALSPLYFEYTAELAYPVPEGVVGGFLTCFNNFIGMIFLFIFFIPNIGYVWMNYVLVASAIFAIPSVIFTKESYRRLDIDVPSSSSNASAQPYSILS